MSSNPQRPQVPSDVKAFNEKLIEEFRANGGQLSGPMAGRQVMLLTTTGRKTGRPRTTVIGYRPDGDGYLAIASANGSDVEPSWFKNLTADPVTTVEVGAETFRARARVATAGERAELAKKIEYLEPQQAKTSREVPIVIFERM